MHVTLVSSKVVLEKLTLKKKKEKKKCLRSLVG